MHHLDETSDLNLMATKIVKTVRDNSKSVIFLAGIGKCYPIIRSHMLIAQMKKEQTVPTYVVLFNIESKGSAKIGSSKAAIVEVFMKGINEMQGYCGPISYLAEFE